jgi:eukaryotic-like serine/threonine-protein kinase
LTKSLRRKIGESLKEVRDAPRLDQVTTASLGALRSYTAGLHANDMRGDFEGAIRHYLEAIRQDSTFAMAHVQLSWSLQALGGSAPLAQAETALTTAFRHRARLPERERYNVEGTYYRIVTHDRVKALHALRRAVELDSANYDAINTLAMLLFETADYGGAERAWRLALKSQPTNGVLLANLASMYSELDHRAAFDSVMDVFERNKVPFPTSWIRAVNYWYRGDYDASEKEALAAAASTEPVMASYAQELLMNTSAARGRLRESEGRRREFSEAMPRVRGDSANPHVVAYARAMMDGVIRGDIARGIAALDAALLATPPASVPVARDGSDWLAFAYARLGKPAKARELLNRLETRLPSGDRTRRSFLLRLRGMIAIAEAKSDSAILHVRRASMGEDGLPVTDCTACTPLLLGLAFDAAGQADSARAYLAQFADRPGSRRDFTDPWFLAPALVRLGELYAEKGDVARASEYYGRFVDFWKKADPELQPRVADVRARMDRMNRMNR